jgi:hypothetical protein
MLRLRSSLRALFTAAIGAMVAPEHPARAQTVRPTGVNVAAQSATTVFLTFDGLTADQKATEAFWCGALVSARPARGLRCAPGTLYGQLPLRYDLAVRGGRAFTDVMSIPASVTRRAYQDAARGRSSEFYYVRRFVDRTGGPDVYVSVICRLTQGGATTPLSLTDVRLTFASSSAVPVLSAEAVPPAWWADVRYTGTGRLVGRWEVVRPGEDAPTPTDLLTEASLPLDERASQRRYMQVGRFNEFLPPAGRVRLAGPDPARLPRDVDGVYLLLLRIEAGDDRDGVTDPSGISSGPVASAAVAGFPLPVLRYVVGRASTADAAAIEEPNSPERLGSVSLLAPAPNAIVPSGPWSFAWVPIAATATYRLEVTTQNGTAVYQALVAGDNATYAPPPFFAKKASGAPLRWRVRAFDLSGRELARSGWRRLDQP